MLRAVSQHDADISRNLVLNTVFSQVNIYMYGFGDNCRGVVGFVSAVCREGLLASVKTCPALALRDTPERAHDVQIAER